MIEAPLPGALGTNVIASPAGQRGFVVNDDFSAASVAPQVDTKSAVTQAQSVGAIGQGVGAIGGALDHIAEIRSNALNQKAVLQVEGAWADTKSQIDAAVANEPDPNKHVEIAQKIIADNQDTLNPPGLSPNAADHVSGMGTLKTGQILGAVNVNSAVTARNQVIEIGAQQAQKLADNGDFDGAAAKFQSLGPGGSNVLGDVGVQQGLDKVAAARKASELKSAQQVLQTATLNGDQTSMEAGVNEVVRITGGSKEAQEAQRNLLMKVGTTAVQEAIQTKQNKTDSNVMAQSALLSAQKAPLTVDQVQQIIDNKIVSPQTGAFMLMAARREWGASDEEVGPILTRAAENNPITDKTGAWKANLEGEFYRLKPNSAQINQFNSAMQDAATRNSNPGGPAASARAQEALALIDQLMIPSQGVDDRTMKFMDAAKNKDYLAAFGLNADAIKTLAGDPGGWFSRKTDAMDGPAALDLFKKAAGADDRKIDPALYNKLPIDVKQLFDDAEHGKLVATLPATDSAIIAAGMGKVDMKDMFNHWYWPQVQAGKTPSADASAAFINDMTKNGKQAGFLQSRSPVKPTAAPAAQDGSASLSPTRGTLTSFAYPGDSTPDRNSSAGKQGSDTSAVTVTGAQTSAPSNTSAIEMPAADAASSPTENDPPSPSDLQQRAKDAGVQLTPQDQPSAQELERKNQTESAPVDQQAPAKGDPVKAGTAVGDPVMAVPPPGWLEVSRQIALDKRDAAHQELVALEKTLPPGPQRTDEQRLQVLTLVKRALHAGAQAHGFTNAMDEQATSPYEVGAQWLTGVGGNDRVTFLPGSTFQKELAASPEAQQARERLARILDKDAPLIASGVKPNVFDSGQYISKDPATHDQKVFYRDLGHEPKEAFVKGFASDMVNAPVRAFLGSFQGRVTIDPSSIDMARRTATVVFRAQNTTGAESGTHLPPPYGYTNRSDGSERSTINSWPAGLVPNNWTHPADWAPKSFYGQNPYGAAGPMHDRSQEILWAETVHF